MKKKKSNSPVGAQILRAREEKLRLVRQHEDRAKEVQENIRPHERNYFTEAIWDLIEEFPIMSPIGLDLVLDPEVKKRLDDSLKVILGRRTDFPAKPYLSLHKTTPKTLDNFFKEKSNKLDS